MANDETKKQRAEQEDAQKRTMDLLAAWEQRKNIPTPSLWEKYFQPAGQELAATLREGISGQTLKEMPQRLKTASNAIGQYVGQPFLDYVGNPGSALYGQAQAAPATEQAPKQELNIDKAKMVQEAQKAVEGQQPPAKLEPTSGTSGGSASYGYSVGGKSGPSISTPTDSYAKSVSASAENEENAMKNLVAVEANAKAEEAGVLAAKADAANQDIINAEKQQQLHKQELDNQQKVLADVQHYGPYEGVSREEVDRVEAAAIDESLPDKVRVKAKLWLNEKKKPLDVQLMSKARTAIAAALSGLQAGVLGRGGNPYLEQLDKWVEQSYMRQAQEQDKRVGAQQNVIGMLKQGFKDGQAARAADRILKYQAFDNELNSLVAKNQGLMQNPQTALAIQQMKAVFGDKVQQNKLKLDDLALDRAKINQQAYQFSEQMKAAQGGQGGANPLDIYGYERLLPGNPNDKKQAQELITAQDALDNDFKVIDENLKKFGGWETIKDKFNASQTGADLTSAGNRVMNTLRTLTGSGAAFSDAEIKFIDPEGLLRNPTNIKLFIDKGEYVNEVYRRYKETAADKISRYGYRKIAEPQLQQLKTQGQAIK